MKKELTWKEKFESCQWKAKQKLDGVKLWCKEHQAEVSVFGPVLISGTVEIFKIVTKKRNLNEERDLKERYIYDRSMGHYYELRRKLKSSEWRQIDERKLEGEPLGQILADMRVLK